MNYHKEVLKIWIQQLKISIDENSTPIRLKWTGRTNICCGDKIFYTNQSTKFLIVLLLMFIETILYQMIYMKIQYYELVLSFLSIYLCISTYCIDPGIMPKIFYKYEDDIEKLQIPQSTKKKENQHNIVRLETHTIRIKYCPTSLQLDWYIYREEKCKIFLFIFAYSKYSVYFRNSKTIYFLINYHIYCLVMIVVLGVITILTFALFCYHTFLICKNQTTNEHLKHTWTLNSGNPYYKGSISKNICNVLFSHIPNQLVYLNRRLFSQPILKTIEDKQFQQVEMSTVNIQTD